MKTVHEISTMSSEEVKTAFFTIMNDVVTAYGDDEDGTKEQQEGKTDATE